MDPLVEPAAGFPAHTTPVAGAAVFVIERRIAPAAGHLAATRRRRIFAGTGCVAHELLTVQRAVEAIDAELDIIFGSASRVEAACALLRSAREQWPAAAAAGVFRHLASRAKQSRGPAVEPLIPLLHDVADTACDPWTILAELVGARDPAVAERALDHACALAACGQLPDRTDLIDAVAAIVEEGPETLRQPDGLERVERLLHASGAGDRASPDLTSLYLHARCGSTRRLAARLLDRPAALPGPDLAEQVLGTEIAGFLAPYFAYSRATHLDLLALSDGSDLEALLEMLQEAERACGAVLLRDVIAEFGWRSINEGLIATRQIGLRIGGSFPALMALEEAALVEECGDTARVSDRFLFVACGASPPDGGTRAVHTTDLVNRFRACSLRHADLLADLLDVAPLTFEKVRRMLHLSEEVVEDFQVLFASLSDECAAVAAAFRTLKADIERELSSCVDGHPLSADLTRRVQTFEDPATPADIRTLHGLKRYLHQRGLRLGLRLAEAGDATDRTMSLAVAEGDRVVRVERPIEFIDFGGVGRGRSLPYVVSMAASAFARQMLHGVRTLPKLRLYCYGNEVHCFAAFRNHPAFIRIDLSPPQRGGMIDVEYCGVSKYDLEWHPNLALTGIEAIFRRIDFHVEITNTRIHARYDKERALDLRDVCRRLESLFNLVPSFMDVDWAIGDLDLSEAARAQVVHAWAERFVEWGVVPMPHVLTSDRRGILAAIETGPTGERELRWSGTDRYRDLYTSDGLPQFWARLRAAIGRRGLDRVLPLAGEHLFSQSTLDEYLLDPLRRAVARGEIVKQRGVLAPAPECEYRARHEASLLAAILDGDRRTLASAARVARVVSALEPTLRFESTGTINGFDVQRAFVPLPGAMLGMYTLRDGGGIPRLALFSASGALFERPDPASGRWTPNWSVDAADLCTRLRDANYTPAGFEDDTPADAPEADVRAAFSAPNTRALSRPLPGDRVLGGVKASPGRAVGLARIGLDDRQPPDVAGGILIAHAIGPRDNPFVFRSAGVVSTGGGILSHAGLLALQFHKPALVVSARVERRPMGGAALVFTTTSCREVAVRVAEFAVVERHHVASAEETVQEGDLVILDADRGVLRVLGQDRDAIALHEGLRQLAASGRSLAAGASDREVLALRGRMLRACHQLERLLGRITDPALARHAATELLAGEAAVAGGARNTERVRLLRALLANAAVGDVAKGTLLESWRAASGNLVAIRAEALRLIPTAVDPLEVLTCRLDVRRAGALVDSIGPLLAACGHAPAAEDAIDAVGIDRAACARLLELRAELAAVVEGARDVGPSPPYLRHALRQLDRLDEVLGVSSDARAAVEAARRRLRATDECTLRRVSALRVVDSTQGGIELWPVVGSKAANLAEAERLGESALIPRWFAVCDRAFREILALPLPQAVAGSSAERGTLDEFIKRTIGRTDIADAQKSLFIRRAWEAMTLPGDFVEELIAAYRRLGAGSESGGLADEDPARPFVAVRSSAREEDIEAATRAGEFDTFLFVRGEDALPAHVKRAWSGLWTERAIHNRALLGTDRDIGGGIVVQRMVRSMVSGVLHTINLAERRLGEMVLNAGLGLGEGIVSGAVAADHIVVSKAQGLAAGHLQLRYVTNDKRERVIFDARFGQGTTTVETLYHQRLRPALEYLELCELVRAAARLERAYCQPLDIEFAFEGTQLRLLQVRPVPAALAAWPETMERHPLARRSS